MISRFLANGESNTIHNNLWKIGSSTLYAIIPEVCDVIWRVLQPEYLKKPSTEKWKEISADFFDFWNYPNCVGSLDGRHFKIKKPTGTGSLYMSYEGFFSCVLMVVADARKKIIWFNFGDYGK